MFELYQVGIASLALLGVFILLAIVTWRKRAKFQGHQFVKPEFTQFSDSGSHGFYVATTFADRPLDRVFAHGLGYAGKARVNVSSEGIQISRTGEQSFRINSASVLKLARNSAVIDKAVEKDGLLAIRWRLGETEVESYLRFPSSQARTSVTQAVSELLGSAR